MKATYTKTPPTFTPVTINITCETQEELDALACVFNYGHLNIAVGEVFEANLRTIREEAAKAGGCFAKHYKFWTSLEADIRSSNCW